MFCQREGAEMRGWQNVGDPKMGSGGNKRWVVYQDEGGKEAAARCSSFLDRNGGQV